MLTADTSLLLLGLPSGVPLSFDAMARSVAWTTWNEATPTPRLARFAERLRTTLQALGAAEVPTSEALTPVGKVRDGLVVLVPGPTPPDRFAMANVASLANNQIVALVEGPPPVRAQAPLQETLDAIVEQLTWNMAHLVLFVEETRWTITTMNGGVLACGSPDARDESFDAVIRESLVPKLAAQVRPPRLDALTFAPGALEVDAPLIRSLADDFQTAGQIWAESGLMLAHTSVEALRYQHPFHRRLATLFLDGRTGMSYGFMAHQLPQSIEPARRAPEGTNGHAAPGCVRLSWHGARWDVPIPAVSVLCTRSGCDKTRVDPRRDLVRLSLDGGEVTLATASGVSKARPSYDTYTILAHALGNALVASLLAANDPSHPFVSALGGRGLAISHWHGYLDADTLPDGYALFGDANPPVACSTPQSAVFALDGKLAAFSASDSTSFRGDVHVEPHHGTNVSGVLSLPETARAVAAASRVEA
ncbi:MAG: hypothetical protein AAGF99_18625 [Bacteroidota bacterium]